MGKFPKRLVLTSGKLSATLLPAWGSKMISLRTEPDGYEFLAPPPFGPHVPNAAAFIPADAYGFDEMFPGVYPQLTLLFPGRTFRSLTMATCGIVLGTMRAVRQKQCCGLRMPEWVGSLTSA